MKNKFIVSCGIFIVFASLIYTSFHGEKYEIMTKSYAFSSSVSTNRTRLREFGTHHNIINIEMDGSDYIVIKYR